MFSDLRGKRKAVAAKDERQVGQQERLMTRNNWQPTEPRQEKLKVSRRHFFRLFVWLPEKIRKRKRQRE